MKKILFISALWLAFWAVTINAQSDKIAGSWLMTKAEINGDVKELYQAFDFNASGKLVAMGMELATWKYDEATNSIVMHSEMDKDFNGASKVLKLTDKEMELEKDGGKFFYTRLNYDEIYKNNKQSGLIGVWEVENNEGAQQLLKLEAPDKFTFTDIYGGATETMRGNWIFNPEDKSMIVVSFHNLFRGKNKIVELTPDKLVIEKDGEKYVAKKGGNESSNIERLTFTEEDFPEEQPDVQLPEAWYDLEQMVEKLADVKELKFKSGRLIKDMDSFNYTTYISKIKVDQEKPSVKFTNLVEEAGEMSQYSENYKGGLSERYNNFFPKKEPYPYRSLGVETITVPAGTFECTVIEGFDMDKKIKYWLINDMPGVYAKTIEEMESPLGDPEYYVTELESIEYAK